MRIEEDIKRVGIEKEVIEGIKWDNNHNIKRVLGDCIERVHVTYRHIVKRDNSKLFE